MERCALFVDAGYALADGAMAVHGTRRRDSVSWDYAGLLKLLAGLAKDRTGLPVLRCYWYETAEGGRTAEHDALAEMPGLKLRLVNTRPGRREGIESQLRRDIVTLAKSGAIAEAFIAGADEHLAEIVAEVQDLGLRVVVLHIASDGGWTIPQPLRQECDDIVEISGVHLRPFVDLIQGAEPAASDEQFASAGYGRRAAADGDGSMTGAMRQSGLPVGAQPAPTGAYSAPVNSNYGSAQRYASAGAADSAQPYASAGAVEADAAAAYRTANQGADVGVRSDQAIFASRGRDSDGSPRQSAGQGQAGHAGQHETAQAGAGGHGGGFGQHAAPTPGAPPPASQSPGRPQASQGAGVQQHASHGSPQHGSHGMPQHAAQGGVPQHGAAAGGGPSANGSAYSASAQPGPQLGSGQATGPQAGSGQAGSPQSGGQFGSGQTHTSHNRTQDSSSPQAGYPDSGPTGMPAQGGGYQSGSAYQVGTTQNGTAFQNGVSQGGPAPGGYQNAGPRAGSQGAPGPAGSGPGVPGQSAYHLSGLTSYQPGSGQNGYPTPGAAPGAGPASNGTAAAGGYQVGYPNGSGHNGAPSYQDGPAQSGSGSYGSLSGYPPGSTQNGAASAPQQRLYGASDQGYFPGQPGAAGPAGTSGSHQRPATGYPASQMQPGGPAQPQYQPQPQDPSALPAIRPAQPVAISLPDAVKAAHGEGFAFGESVGRGAPGLWLEAVLARKPRMPSDLEAKLLQGSALPIDSLLHDEVRHSLRRGFWEALESARR